MTLSPRAIEAAAEAMKLGVCQYCRQPAVGAGGGVVDCNCPYRVWDEPTDKERAQIALTAALAVDGVALQGWQPIESAPKDRPLLLAAYIVPSDEAQRNGSRPIWHIETGRAFGTKLDRWTNVLGQQPSHWQPLPQPPAASDREERRLPTPGTEG
jgi:hypothetical protein